MNNIFYYVFILPISYLPNKVLYLISSFFYPILYKLLKYRRKIVRENLKKSFPEKSSEELLIVEQNFYKHFCDLLLESFKGFTISKDQSEKKIRINNQELVDKYADNGQNVILIGGHYNNWELTAQRMPLVFKHDLYAIYKPLSNKFFDNKMRKSREKFGLKMIPMKTTKEYFTIDSDRPRAIIFGSDQSPSNAKKALWINFLNQESAFLYGAEKYAKDFNWPVIYVSIDKIKRGYYEVEYKLITDSPNKERYGNIISDFAKLLELDINNAPPYWLWTHKRWKKKKV